MKKDLKQTHRDLNKFLALDLSEVDLAFVESKVTFEAMKASGQQSLGTAPSKSNLFSYKFFRSGKVGEGRSAIEDEEESQAWKNWIERNDAKFDGFYLPWRQDKPKL